MGIEALPSCAYSSIGLRMVGRKHGKLDQRKK